MDQGPSIRITRHVFALNSRFDRGKYALFIGCKRLKNRRVKARLIVGGVNRLWAPGTDDSWDGCVGNLAKCTERFDMPLRFTPEVGGGVVRVELVLTRVSFEKTYP